MELLAKYDPALLWAIGAGLFLLLILFVKNGSKAGEIERLERRLRDKIQDLNQVNLDKGDLNKSISAIELEGSKKDILLANQREENSMNKSLTLPPGRGFYVYEYFNAQTGDVVYVGKGTNNRFAEYEDRHLGIRKLRDRGKLGVRIVKENIDYSEDANHFEKHLILSHVDNGTKLYNKSHNPAENQLVK